MILLQTHGLSKEFSRRSTRGQTAFAAVSDVNMTIEEGAFVTITGKSGSGKTTLLTMLAGLAAPSAGTVMFRNRDLHGLPDRELSLLRNREFGFVPQGAGLLGNLTVYDNIRAPQMFAGGNGANSSRADFLLESFGIYDLAEEYPASLSGGEMRRASIARALFNDPALLIADEPTSDLDSENTRSVLALLQRVNSQGATVVVVTHEKEVAACGNVRFRMENGKLVL